MTAALEGSEWSAARPGRTLPPGKTRYPLYRRVGGPQGRSGLAENLVPTGIRSRTVQPVVSRYSDWATGPINIYHPVNISTVIMLCVFLSAISAHGRVSSVGIATRYGLDGPRIESRGDESFRTLPDRPWGHPSSYTMGTGFCTGVKRPGRGVDHPSSTEVKGRVELNLYSPSAPSWPVLGWPLASPS